MPRSTLTVLLACRDRLELLRESVRSALDQAGDGVDVLVVDDGSGEATRSYLDQLSGEDRRLRVVHQPATGVGAARARGVLEASGELVCILDSDDLLEPGAIERVRSALDAAPSIDLVYGNIRTFRAGGPSRTLRYPAFASNERFVLAVLAAPRVPFKHSGTTFRRRVALEVGSYDPTLPLKIDLDFVLRLVRAGKQIRHLGGPALVAFREHASSISRRRRDGIAAWFLLVDRYGPPSRVARWSIKVARALAEGLKAAVEATRW